MLKFMVDQTLGRLGRWLRTLGCDTADYKGAIDRGFLNAARDEGRLALSRKRDMARRNYRGTLIIIEEDQVEDQIRALIEKLRLNLEPDRIFTICLDCNAELMPVAKEDVRREVPEYVFATQEEFRNCPICGRIYWAGTHKERALAFIRQILKKS